MATGERFSPKAWSDPERDVLRSLYEGRDAKTTPEIVQLMGRTISSIEGEARRLKLYRDPEWLAAQGKLHSAKNATARACQARGMRPPKPWPDHRFEDDPRAAEDWRFAQPRRMARPAPDRTLGGVATGEVVQMVRPGQPDAIERRADVVQLPYGPCSALTLDEAWLEFRGAKLAELARPTPERKAAVTMAYRKYVAALQREEIGIDG